MIELFLSKMVSEAPYKFTKAPWTRFQDFYDWLCDSSLLHYEWLEVQACWHHGWKTKNKVFKIWWLALRFRLAAHWKKKACKWKWSKNVVTRYYVLLRAYKLHKLVHATQARSRYQNTRYQATQIRRKILFSRFGDVHYWTMRHSHANSFEVCIFRRDLSSRSRVCQHNRCRHMLQQWCIFKTWSVACCGFPRKMVDKSIRTMHDRSRGVLDLKFLVCILAM